MNLSDSMILDKYFGHGGEASVVMRGRVNSDNGRGRGSKSRRRANSIVAAKCMTLRQSHALDEVALMKIFTATG